MQTAQQDAIGVQQKVRRLPSAPHCSPLLCKMVLLNLLLFKVFLSLSAKLFHLFKNVPYYSPKKNFTGYQLLHVEWYAPGVGLVRAISNEGEGTPIKSLPELLWYNVEK